MKTINVSKKEIKKVKDHCEYMFENPLVDKEAMVEIEGVYNTIRWLFEDHSCPVDFNDKFDKYI